MAHKHKEAFCLMQYHTDDGLEFEILWNSRDGVTPFIIPNRIGMREMKHANWHEDQYGPYYVPPVGTRIFIDMTKEKLLEYKRALVEKAWEDPKMQMKSHPYFEGLSKEEAAQRLAQDSWQEGMPDIVVVDEDLNERLNERARQELTRLAKEPGPVRFG